MHCNHWHNFRISLHDACKLKFNFIFHKTFKFLVSGWSVDSETCRLLRRVVHCLYFGYRRTLYILLHIRSRPTLQRHWIHAWLQTKLLLAFLLEIRHARLDDSDFSLHIDYSWAAERRWSWLPTNCTHHWNVHHCFRISSVASFCHLRHLHTERRHTLEGKKNRWNFFENQFSTFL